MKYNQLFFLIDNFVFIEPWQGHTHLGMTMTTDRHLLSLEQHLWLSSYIREAGEGKK